MKLNMLPRFLKNDTGNIRLCYFILFCNFLLVKTISKFCSDFNYIFISKFCHGIHVSFSWVSIFFKSIFKIFFGSSKKEVGWPNTSRDITFMANQKTFRNNPFFQFPSKSMRSFPYIALRLINKKLSIAISVKRISPNPACLGFFDFAPKSFFARNHTMLISQIGVI